MSHRRLQSRRDRTRRNRAIDTVLVIHDPTPEKLLEALREPKGTIRLWDPRSILTEEPIEPRDKKTLLDCFLWDEDLEDCIRPDLLAALLQAGAKSKCVRQRGCALIGPYSREYLEAAQERADPRLTLLFACYALDEAHSYHSDEEKRLWEVAVDFTAARADKRFNTEWVEGHKPEDIVTFLASRKDLHDTLDAVPEFYTFLGEILGQAKNCDMETYTACPALYKEGMERSERQQNVSPLPTIKLLAKHSIAVSASIDGAPPTLLLMALEHGSSREHVDKGLSLIEELIARDTGKTMVNIADKSGRPPLGVALAGGQVRIAHALLKGGASVERMDTIVQRLKRKGPRHIETDEYIPYLSLLHSLITSGVSNAHVRDLAGLWFDPKVATHFKADDFISDARQLCKPLMELPLEVMATTRNLAHLLGDAFVREQVDDVTGEMLEGNTFSDSSAFLVKLMERTDFAQAQEGTKLNRMIRQAFETARLIDSINLYKGVPDESDLRSMIEKIGGHILKEIQRLPEGESYLLPVGWVGEAEGHAMLLKFTKEEHGSFKLTLYNTGAGVEYHLKDPFDKKIKILPCVEFTGVGADQIGAPDFLQSLIETRKIPILRPEAGGLYSQRDLYEGILRRFDDKRVQRPPKDLSRFISGQRSGTCSLRCFLAVMREELGKKEYKGLKLALQESALQVGVDTSVDLESAETRRGLLADATANVARAVRKRRKRGQLAGPSADEHVSLLMNLSAKIRAATPANRSVHEDFAMDLSTPAPVEGTEKLRATVEKWAVDYAPFAVSRSGAFAPKKLPSLPFWRWKKSPTMRAVA